MESLPFISIRPRAGMQKWRVPIRHGDDCSITRLGVLDGLSVFIADVVDEEGTLHGYLAPYRRLFR